MDHFHQRVYNKIQKIYMSIENAKVACTMNISLDDFEPMLTGCLDPITAFMGGKMKVSGDMK